MHSIFYETALWDECWDKTLQPVRVTPWWCHWQVHHLASIDKRVDFIKLAKTLFLLRLVSHRLVWPWAFQIYKRFGQCEALDGKSLTYYMTSLCAELLKSNMRFGNFYSLHFLPKGGSFTGSSLHDSAFIFSSESQAWVHQVTVVQVFIHTHQLLNDHTASGAVRN